MLAALLMLQTELRTLEKHAGANEKISQQRRIWEGRKSVRGTGGGGATSSALSAQEKPLAHKDETLEYKRQLAALGDKVTYQERLNALAQQADKSRTAATAKRVAIEAKSRG